MNATKTSSTLAGRKKHWSSVHFAAGYKLEATERDEALQAKAVEVAASCDVAVVFIGLSEVDESEGFDRAHMRLPEHHNAQIGRASGRESVYNPVGAGSLTKENTSMATRITRGDS